MVFMFVRFICHFNLFPQERVNNLPHCVQHIVCQRLATSNKINPLYFGVSTLKKAAGYINDVQQLTYVRYHTSDIKAIDKRLLKAVKTSYL